MGLALRLLAASLLQSGPSAMASWYLGSAIQISQGGGFTIGGEPTAYYPVGYPAFLAALLTMLGTRPMAVRLATALLSWLALVLVYSIARRRSEMTGRIALALMALYPNQIAYVSIPHPEVLEQSLVLLASWLWIRGRLESGGRRGKSSFLFSGLCFGLATLTKPTAFLVPAIFALVDGSLRRENRRRSIAALVLVYSVLVAVVAPWTVRNFLVSGVPIPVSTNLGINLFIGSGGTLDSGNSPRSSAVPGTQGEILRDREYRSMAWRALTADPLAAVGRIPGKLVGLYARDDEGLRYHAQVIYSISSWPRGPAIFQISLRGARIYYYGVVLLLAWGATRRKRELSPPRQPWLSGMVLGMVAYYSMLYGIVFFGTPRFHFGLVPWLVMGAAMTLAGALERQQVQNSVSVRG